MKVKKHYLLRNRRWWVFRSREVAKEFLSSIHLHERYRHDLAPSQAVRGYHMEDGSIVYDYD